LRNRPLGDGKYHDYFTGRDYSKTDIKNTHHRNLKFLKTQKKYICLHLTISGFAQAGFPATFARESIKLSFRSELSTRGKARLCETARCMKWLPSHNTFRQWYVSGQVPFSFLERG
jgi:hypothetical protein